MLLLCSPLVLASLEKKAARRDRVRPSCGYSAIAAAAIAAAAFASSALASTALAAALAATLAAAALAAALAPADALLGHVPR